MPNKIILGFVGELAAGKGTVAKYISEKHGATSHRFSTALRDALNRLYLEINRENLQTLSTILRKNFSEDILAKVIAKDVEEDKNNIIVIDGIRRPADIIYLKKLPEFKLIAINADIKKRYERLIIRGENEDDKNKTFEQFIKDHKAEPELEIPNLMKTADIQIDNNGGYEELYALIDKVIEEVLK